MVKNIRNNCELCGTINRLEVDHINENHNDNRPENLRVLCKYCHKEKTKIGKDLFEVLLGVGRDSRVKARLRVSSARWMSSIKDARPKDESVNYQLSFFDEPDDPVTTLSHEQSEYIRDLVDRTVIPEDIR